MEVKPRQGSDNLGVASYFRLGLHLNTPDSPFGLSVYTGLPVDDSNRWSTFVTHRFLMIVYFGRIYELLDHSKPSAPSSTMFLLMIGLLSYVSNSVILRSSTPSSLWVLV
jgi:hypothetical protein